MIDPVLAAKTSLPALPASYLARERLDTLWEDWPRRRLVCVTAGAGFGKTSFLSAGARHLSRPPIWYALDEQDVQAAGFCRRLALAIAGDSENLRAQLDSSDPDLSGRALTIILRALREGEPGRFICLDDVQLLAPSPEALQFLDRLIRFLPEGATLLLSSRERVDIALTRLRAQGALAELDGGELRFNELETASFLAARFPNLDLPAALLRLIVQQTEGWAAGLEILCQVMDGSSLAQVEEALVRLRAAGSGWFAFFAEEVLDRLDEETRDFLLRSSLLPCLEAALCDRVLSRKDSAALLSRVAERNLFTFAGEDGSFRYHHLFRDFLRERLSRELSPAELRRLQRRAAKALYEAARWSDAMAAWAESGSGKEVIHLVTERGAELIAMGAFDSIARAFELLPDELLDGQPQALSLLGKVHDTQGRWAEAEELYRRALSVCPSGARRIELMISLSLLAIRHGDYHAGMEICREALEQEGADEPISRARIEINLGVATCELGRYKEGEKHLLASLALHQEVGSAEGEAMSRYLLASNVYVKLGHFRLAMDHARQALVIARKSGQPRLICHSMNTYGYVAALAGDFRRGRELAGGALRLTESLEYRMAEGYCHWSMGRCALFTRDLEPAREHFEKARSIGLELGEATLRTFPQLGLAELALLEGNRPLATCLAEEAAGNAKDAGSKLHQAQSLILLGLAAGGKEAAAHWRKAEKTLRRLGSRCDLHRVLLLRLAAGDLPKAERGDALEELVRGVAAAEHEFLFLQIEPERAALVLVEALRHGVETDYVRQLLVTLGARTLPALAGLPTNMGGELREIVIDVLARIGGAEAEKLQSRFAKDDPSGKAAREIKADTAKRPRLPMMIEALGALRVRIGERELTLEHWKSSRALRLFQLLLVHDFRWVPRDVIVDGLWPDTEASRGANNLRQTIHVLRKILEPKIEQTRDSHYIRYRGETCRLDPGEGFSYDLHEFQKALDRADSLWNTKARAKAAEHLSRAAELYRDDFLLESPYEEFSALAREQARDRLLRGLGRHLLLLVEAENWQEVLPLSRRALTQDPFQEDFHWQLVNAHHCLGNRKEALTAYQNYEEVMDRELDLLPSLRMKSLADRIVSGS